MLAGVEISLAADDRGETRIAELRACLNSREADVVGALGEQLAQLRDIQPLMSNARFVTRLYSVLHEWLMGLLDGSLNGERAKERRAFVRKLTDVDLTFEDVILLDGLARRQLFELVREQLSSSDSQSAMMYTLDKALTLDLVLIYSGYCYIRDAEMERALLDRFIKVTGFSRTLYDNLAEAQGHGSVAQ
ncbi:MAG: hypothetical protein B6I35_15735 [Anaerolineaceae bacterium 4572_32.2]|nr:MAG: hypothetical protein B6I35_15735 [Anaerolineaceae bacterium 4572_32.2]